MLKHYTIPIFIPELACPNQCIFCNQHSISDRLNQPSIAEIKNTIETHLSTIYTDKNHVEIAFFGGNFTGIPLDMIINYLSVAKNYVIKNNLKGIRISTRPDYINEKILKILQYYNVTAIELGAQSLDDNVLKFAGRGHSVNDVVVAAKKIKDFNFELGLQMMIGLPNDNFENAKKTAYKIIELKADTTRIYPTLVIKGTKLAEIWEQKRYIPLTLNEAIEQCAELIKIFRKANIRILKVGLHPNNELTANKSLLAGPFHANLRQLAESWIWRQKLIDIIKISNNREKIIIDVNKNEINYAIGNNSDNKIMLEKHFEKVVFNITNNKTEKVFLSDKKMPLYAKNKIKTNAFFIGLATNNIVYKSISGHPDIFICESNDTIIVAPCVKEKIEIFLKKTDKKIIIGDENPSNIYPASAIYNAVITDEFIIHNSKVTSKKIIEVFNNRELLNVKQAYTRCNLIALNNNSFITSDKNIEKKLAEKGKQALYFDPSEIVLKGHKNGFIGGCCGISDKTLFLNGSLKYYTQENNFKDFVIKNGYEIIELYDGKLVDVGGIYIA